jgi:glycosyltransferase involved in cell wall biosynthesis
MAVGTPVVGKVPNMKPEWMSDKNGVWTFDYNGIVDVVAEFTQNWLEDNISEQLYQSGYETAERYMDETNFNQSVIREFSEYLNTRKESFQTQLDKIKLEVVE